MKLFIYFCLIDLPAIIINNENYKIMQILVIFFLFLDLKNVIPAIHLKNFQFSHFCIIDPCIQKLLFVDLHVLHVTNHWHLWLCLILYLFFQIMMIVFYLSYLKMSHHMYCTEWTQRTIKDTNGFSLLIRQILLRYICHC